jgi:hypothetical protein
VFAFVFTCSLYHTFFSCLSQFDQITRCVDPGHGGKGGDGGHGGLSGNGGNGAVGMDGGEGGAIKIFCERGDEDLLMVRLRLIYEKQLYVCVLLSSRWPPT